MMAHDPSAQRPDLSGPAIAGLEKALTHFLANPSDTARVESALRVVTAEARAKQMHAEHLLVLLKDVWFSLPPIRETPSGERQNVLLQRVITQCIREYYSS
jgi:hypothetical protein